MFQSLSLTRINRKSCQSNKKSAAVCVRLRQKNHDMKKLIFLIVSITSLILLAGQPTAFSQNNNQDNNPEYFYYSDHKKIPLAPSSDHIALRFKTGKKYHISKRFPSLVLPTKEKDLKKNRLVVFNLQTNLTNADVKKLKQGLSRDPSVELVVPVFTAPGASMIVTDEFIVQFAPNISPNDIADLNNIYGVEIVKKVTWSKNTYILRVLNGDALDMANTFHELEEVIFAHPDFVRVMQLRPQSVYDRLYESNESVIIGPNGEILPPDTPIKKNGNNQCRMIKPSSMTLPKPQSSGPLFSPQAPVLETTINTEGFEGTSPGDLPDGWQSFGTPTWGVVDYRSYSGAHSVYCVGTGVTPPGPYPNSCTAWMWFGPFSLLDAQDARVDLQARITTEINYDTLFIGASLNGNEFYGYSLSGNWAAESGGDGWMNIAFDLTRVYSLGDLCEEPNVWIALVFQSDFSLEYEGVYVDDIVIEKIIGGYEDLTSDDHDHLQWSLNNNGQLWGMEGADIAAVDAWGISQGSESITIAIIDEGVDLTHPDLADKIVPGYDATASGSLGAPAGDDAHGTNCAGIAAAITDNYLGVAGIARLARIMPVRIAYGSGGGWVTTDSWIADGINWAVTNGADVLSNSWGGGSESTAINSAIDNAKINGRGGKGAVVVFAAGNDNGPVIYPATLERVLAVGALSPCDERKSPTSCDGEWWWGSNYGAELDISAPGVHMYSTDIQGAAGYDPGDYFYNFNGTSSATPVVAGVAALVLGYCPDLNALEVEDILKSGADDLGVEGWDQYTGFGRVNAYETLLNIECVDEEKLEGDFNGDGKTDILWRNMTTGQVYVWLMGGTAKLSAGSPGTVSNLDWEIIDVGNFNSATDDNTDILWRNMTTGQVYVWLMDGTATLSTGSPGTVSNLDWEIIDVGDFNGGTDSMSDILWRNMTTGQVYVWLMNGTAKLSAASPGTVSDLDWEILDVGNFNGATDSNTDILWRNMTTGQVYVWLMDGTAKLSAASPGTVSDLDWEIIDVGNFNGTTDGNTDILWRNKTTGQVYAWLMNGTAKLSAASPGTVSDLAWEIVNVGNFNGDADGNTDILWRNMTTGQVYVWLMDGTAKLSAASLGTVGDLDWEIQ